MTESLVVAEFGVLANSTLRGHRVPFRHPDARGGHALWVMAYAFEDLRVWQAALAYDDLVCRFAAVLPPSERFGLTTQARRASSSIALNIAEGSTSQSDPEKARFLGYAIRSLVDTVAVQRLAERRGYATEDPTREMYATGQRLFKQLQAFRQAVLQRVEAS